MESGIRCGRWEDLILEIPNESVDLVLTDPPYGLGYVSNIPGDKRWNQSGESESRFNEALVGDSPEENEAIDWRLFFQQCYRVLKNDRYCVLHCNVPFVGRKWENIVASGLRYKGTLAWNKRFAVGGDLKGAAKRDWEPIVYMAKGKPKLNPLKVTRNGKLQERKRISEIEDWVFQLTRDERCGHPTQKPVALAEQLVLWMTDEEGVILDPFAGSGTTIEAAEKHSRLGIGFELEEKFCLIADERLRRMKD